MVFESRGATMMLSMRSPGRLQAPPPLLMWVRGRVDGLRVARVNDDVVDEEPGAVEARDARPVVAAVGRSVHLPIDGAEVETARILRVDDKRAHVAPQGAGGLPVQKTLTRR